MVNFDLKDLNILVILNTQNWVHVSFDTHMLVMAVGVYTGALLYAKGSAAKLGLWGQQTFTILNKENSYNGHPSHPKVDSNVIDWKNQ